MGNKITYICECGKKFDTLQALNGHKAMCEICVEQRRIKHTNIENEYDSYGFICNCGRKFKTQLSLNSHARFCDKYVKIDKTSTYKNKDTGEYICECGYTTDNFQSLNSHFSHCYLHREKTNKDCSVNYWNIRNHPGKMQGWENFSNEEKQQFFKNGGKTHSKRLKSGELINLWTGRKETEEHKEHIRIGILKKLKELNGGNFRCMYSKNGCEFINQLNEKYDWQLQHAENGGEVSKLGYFFDGYDLSKNIVFEYDEGFHYDDIESNRLKQKDIERQYYIISKLKCEFYRYNEKNNTLYKIINASQNDYDIEIIK